MAEQENNSSIIARINAGLATLDPEIFGFVVRNRGYAFVFILNSGEAAAIHEAVNGFKMYAVKRGWYRVHLAIEDIRAAGKTPILIELAGADQVPGAIIIDHHHDRPAALLQVLHLLGKEPTRFQQLIAANASGHFAAMEAMGATDAEMYAVRAYDRKYQLKEEPYGSGLWVPKFTTEMEQEAQRAIAAKEVCGPLTIIRMAQAETDAVTDSLHKKGEEQCLLILSQWEENGESKTEVKFFGDWSLCEDLFRRYGEAKQWHTRKDGPTILPNGASTGYFVSSVASFETVVPIVREWFGVY